MAELNLSDELLERARGCKTPQEVLDLLSDEGVELPDEIIALIAGGKQDFAAFGLEIPGFFFDQFKDFNPTSFLTALSEVVATLPAFKNPM